MMEQEDDDQIERLVNEGANFCLLSGASAGKMLTTITEYKTWKKNSPFLYDMILGCVN